MGWQLTRDEVKVIVFKALSTVADFNSQGMDVETFSFERFHDFHKKVFLSKLKMLLLEKQKRDNCYNVALNESMPSKWRTIKACIDYVYERQERVQVEPNVEI